MNGATASLIELTPELLINTGANRACYRHPDDPGRCVKVDLADATGGGTRAGTNRWEHDYHLQLAAKLGDDFFHHAPRCFGFADTSLGQGLVFELIRCADGEPARSLREVLEQKAGGDAIDRDQLLGMIDALEAFVFRRRAWLFDVNPKNLLIRRSSGGVWEMVAIDWKGVAALREWHMMSTWMPGFGRLKIRRRFNRLRQQVRDRARA